MKNILLVVFCVLFLVSAGFNYDGYSTIRDINEEVSTASESFEPTHKCQSRLDVFPNGLYCFAVTDSKKTCYTLPDRKGGKRCLDEPYWEEIPPEEVEICPECDMILCPEPTACPPAPICPAPVHCIQTCKGCGSGGSCPSCPTCPECTPVMIIGYTDYGKYVCDTSSLICVRDGDLMLENICNLG